MALERRSPKGIACDETCGIIFYSKRWKVDGFVSWDFLRHRAKSEMPDFPWLMRKLQFALLSRGFAVDKYIKLKGRAWRYCKAAFYSTAL